MKRFLYVTFGSILFASGFTLFIEPLNVAPGGLAGIVVILTKLYPFINTGAFFLLLNIPLLLIGAITFGIKFFFGTVYATLVSSIMMSFSLTVNSISEGSKSFVSYICGTIRLR